MSTLRDALTRPAAYAVCRRMGHHWQPDGRCSCCRALRDDATTPYAPAISPHTGGVPIGQATTVMAPRERTGGSSRSETCARGHAEWRTRPSGTRYCAACQRGRV